MRIHELKVLGTTTELERLLDEVEPDEVIIAIPSAPGVAARDAWCARAATATSRCARCPACSS